MRLSGRASVACGAAFAASLLALTGTNAAAAPQEQGVREIDWHNTAFEVPEIGPCPQQVVDFVDGAAQLPDHLYRFAPEHDIVFADVTDDGVEEALMLVECGSPNSEYTRALVAMTADPEVRLVGPVESPPRWTMMPADFSVEPDQIVRATIIDHEENRTFDRRYTWSSEYRAFLNIDG